MKRSGLKEFQLLAFSVSIGALAACGAVGFRSLIEIFQELFWFGGDNFYQQVLNSPWWFRLLIPAGAGLLVGPIIRYWVPEARGPGVPEVIVAVAVRQSTIRHRVTAMKTLITSLLIGAGASVGREGPIVQIGASIGSSIAQFFRLNPNSRRVCLACGAAAGISATFNAPVAGTVFAVEIILLDIEVGYISHIVIASVVATVLSRIFWGAFPTFEITGFHLVYYWELLLYLALGILAGLASILFVKLVYGTDTLFRRAALPEWVKPGLGGLLLGGIALQFPQVLGVGYETVNMALAGELALRIASLLFLAKLAATAVSIGSGMSGGIFAPSLVLGATLGTTLERFAAELLPASALLPSDYALAGMGAVVAGTTLAPITAILTIFELTYSYEVILPLMVSCIASTLVVKVLFGYSVYEMKMLRQGINLVRGHDVGILRNLHVRDIMTRQYPYLYEQTPLGEVIEKMTSSSYPHFVVFDDVGELSGMLSMRDLRSVLGREDELEGLVVARDLMCPNVVTLSTMDNMARALALFEEHRVSCVPVTLAGNPRSVVGILKKDDLLEAYQERVLRDRILSESRW